MALTPAVVRYAATGLTTDPAGTTRRKNHLFAKISREEVAIRFLEPPPAEILRTLVERGQLTAAEARLADALPLAEDLTAEADSGGHTDNRPLTALLPAILRLRDRVVAERGYRQAVRVGAGGGLGTPSSVAAAFALGASYVVTGSVNQACVESGLHESGRALLAEAGIADVIMAPAADMFELGVTVQVLRRGTMFAVRAKKLYELYRSYPSLESIPAAEREKVETQLLRATFAEAWESTRAFWAARDPREVARAEADPRHRMALVFRSYLGLSSRWAIAGEPDRGADFQIWCGPAMGAFNSWVRGSFLEKPDSPDRRPGRPQPDGGGRRGDARAAAPRLGPRRPALRLRLPPPSPRLTLRPAASGYVRCRGPNDPRSFPEPSRPSPSSASAPSSPAPPTPPASGRTSSPART